VTKNGFYSIDTCMNKNTTGAIDQVYGPAQVKVLPGIL
jgi:hypothetical protein